MKKIDLKAIKEKEEKKSTSWVRVGMSTCGIAAGAEKIYEYIREQVDKNNLEISLRKCGCLGACYAEPLVEVKVEGLPAVVYGNVDMERASLIVEEHLAGGKVLDSGIYELQV